MTTRKIEIFRTGTHRAMDGSEHVFDAARLQEIVGTYDPATHEAPIVVGHPEHDDPAFGWVKGLRVDGDRLIAETDQVDPEFADMVKAGRFKKRSPAFYAPDSKGNPTPGKWHLRHVGFLGAMPPSVKGLKPAAFAADDSFVAFGDMETVGRILRSVASALQRVREFIIESSSVEQADKVLPGWSIETINEQTAWLDDKTKSPAWSEPENPENDVSTQDIAKRQKELDDRDAAIAAKETDLAKRAQAARLATDAAFVEGLVTEGRVLPAEKDGLVAFMGTLPETEDAVAFGEGEKAKKTSPVAFLQGFLKGLPKRVDFSERAPGGAGGEPPSNDAVAFAEQIRTEQAEVLRKTGSEISVTEAAARIKKRATS